MSDDPTGKTEIRTIEVRGLRVDLIPSGAARPLVPTIPPQRMTWEVRASDDAALLYGYIDAEHADELYAFDPVAFEFGLGIACQTVEQAVELLVDITLPQAESPAVGL